MSVQNLERMTDMNLQEWQDLAIQRSFDLERAVERIEKQEEQLKLFRTVNDNYFNSNWDLKMEVSVLENELSQYKEKLNKLIFGNGK